MNTFREGVFLLLVFLVVSGIAQTNLPPIWAPYVAGSVLGYGAAVGTNGLSCMTTDGNDDGSTLALFAQLQDLRSNGFEQGPLQGPAYGLPVLPPVGSELWHYSGPNFTLLGLAIADDGMIYLAGNNPNGSFPGTNNSRVIALGPNGETRWTVAFGDLLERIDSAFGPVLGTNGDLYVGTTSNSLVCVSNAGVLMWTAVDGAVTAPAAVGANGIVRWPGAPTNLTASVAAPGGTVIHLTWEGAAAATSHEVWRAVGTNFNQAQPIATNLSGVLRFDDDTTRGGVIYGYWTRGMNAEGPGPFIGPATASQTNQLWAASLGSWAPLLASYFTTPVVAEDGTVYVAAMYTDSKGVSRSELRAYDPAGTQLWEFADNVLLSDPAISPNGNLVYAIGDSPSSVRAVTRNGQHAWTTRVSTGYLGNPAIDPYGTSYFSNGDSYYGACLYAVSTDGVVLWKATCGAPTDHPAIDANGNIYLGWRSTIACFNANGTSRWYRNALYDKVWGTPSLNQAGEMVTILNENSPSFLGMSLMRYAQDGTLKATNRMAFYRGMITQEPIIFADGATCFAASQLIVVAEASGAARWTSTAQTLFSSGAPIPALDRAGNVYFAIGKEILVFDSKGSQIARTELGTYAGLVPVLTPEGRLYIIGNRRLYAFAALAGLDTVSPWPMYRHDPRGTACQPGPLASPVHPVLATEQRPFANKVRVSTEPTTIPAALELFRSVTSDFAAATKVAEGLAGQPFVEDRNVPPGIAFYYWVRAKNAGGLSDFTGPVVMQAVAVPVRWLKEIPGAQPIPPAIDPAGTIYPVITNTLLALNPNGTTKWQINGLSGAPSVAPDGAIILRSGDRAYSLTSAGATNWSIAGVSTANVVPAIAADSTVLVPGLGAELVAFDTSGTPVWRTKVGNNSGYSPTVAADGSVVFGALGTKLIHLHPDGSTNAVLALSDSFQSVAAPVLDADGTVYLRASQYRSLVATRMDGSTKWKLTSAESVQSPPVVGPDGTVFAGRSVTNAEWVSDSISIPRYHQQIAALRDDGSIRWAYTVGAISSSPALAANGTLLVSAVSNLFALSAEDGRLLWQMEAPSGLTMGAPILDVDGILYVPMTGGLMALEFNSGPAISPWPMHRQNPRQSACLARLTAPKARILLSNQGLAELDLVAPGGAIVLTSQDLHRWQRLRWQPQSSQSVTWPLNFELPVGFYQVLAP